jgi:leucyl aminopeptidase (aminopeptidase T)
MHAWHGPAPQAQVKQLEELLVETRHDGDELTKALSGALTKAKARIAANEAQIDEDQRMLAVRATQVAEMEARLAELERSVRSPFCHVALPCWHVLLLVSVVP